MKDKQESTKVQDLSSASFTPSTMTDKVYAQVQDLEATNGGNEDLAPLVQARVAFSGASEENNVRKGGLAAGWTVGIYGHSEQPDYSFTRSITTRVGKLVVTETPLPGDPDNENIPAYMTAQGPVGIPYQCQIQEEKDQTIIQVRWLDFTVFFIAFFTIFWDFCIVLTALSAGWEVLLIPHAWVGLLLSYLTVCGFVNSTYITISRDCVEVDQRPLKLRFWGSNKIMFNKSGHEEMRVKRRLTTGGESVSISYEVHKWDYRNGSFVVLPMRNLTMDLAFFVAQEIQKYLAPRIAEASVVAEIEVV